MNLSLCPDAVPNLLMVFDIAIAPPLLLYSYVPIFILCVFFAWFIAKNDYGSIQSKYFLGITLSLAIWIALVLFQWIGAYLEVVHLAWQLLLLPEITIFISACFFSFTFLFKRDASNIYKNFSLLILAAVSLLLPTQVNINMFDLVNCEGVVGPAWRWIYIFELICIVIIVFIALRYLRTEDGRKERVKTVLFTTGLTYFLSIFWASNYFAETTKTYEINLIGPIGMFLFLGIISYMMVKFRVFKAKLFASQILVIVLWGLIAALLFIQSIDYIHIVVLCTLALVSIFGLSLIKSVKREIEQREKIELLAADLKIANDQLHELDRQKDELLGIVAHQLAKPITAIRWDLESLLDGDLGTLNEKQQEEAKTMRSQAVNLADLVSMILDVSRIQLGKIKLEPQPLDMNEFFKDILDVIEPSVKQKKLNFVKDMPKNLPTVLLDKRYTRMTIENLMTNAVKYTPDGGKVELVVKVVDGVMHGRVTDTGCGIPKEDQGKIFGKMYRATNVRNTVDGNGFGLYVAKGAIEGQGGKIWFESTEGKGTTFFFEIPMIEPAPVVPKT